MKEKEFKEIKVLLKTEQTVLMYQELKKIQKYKEDSDKTSTKSMQERPKRH